MPSKHTLSATAKLLPQYVCLRCQLQQQRRLYTSYRTHRKPSHYTSWSRQILPARHQRIIRTFHHAVPNLQMHEVEPDAPVDDGRHLVILQTPTRRPFRRMQDKKVPIALDTAQLNDMIENLLKFEESLKTGSIITDIDLARPEEQIVSEPRFRQLSRMLSTGFKRQHLLDYLRSQNSLEGLNNSRKGILVDQVLRRAWDIQVSEEINADKDLIRETDFASDTKNIFFLLSENGQVLRDLAQEFRIRITVDIEQNSIRLIGTRDKIDGALEILDSLREGLVFEDLDLSPFKRFEGFDQSIMASISKLTKTFIEAVDNGMLRVWTLSNQMKRIDEVRRLIYQSQNIQLRESHSLLCNRSVNALETGGLYSYSEDAALPWIYRNRSWSRWRGLRYRLDRTKGPASKLPVGVPTVFGPSKQSLTSFPGIKSYLDEQSMDPPNAPSNIAVEYHAVLGSILYETPDSQIAKRKPIGLTRLLDEQPARILSHTVPNITNVLNQAEPILGVEELTFLLRFSPSPWAHPENFEELPQIELLLRIDSKTGAISRPRLHAISSLTTADVLMPDAPADLRFIRRATVPLNHQSDAVQRYLADSDLNILSGKVLAPASKAIFNLPGWLVGASSFSLNEKEYLFKNLEFQSTMHFQWQNLPVSYSKIEAGSTGGRRTEVICRHLPGMTTRSIADMITSGEASEEDAHEFGTALDLDFPEEELFLDMDMESSEPRGIRSQKDPFATVNLDWNDAFTGEMVNDSNDTDLFRPKSNSESPQGINSYRALAEMNARSARQSSASPSSTPSTPEVNKALDNILDFTDMPEDNDDISAFEGKEPIQPVLTAQTSTSDQDFPTLQQKPSLGRPYGYDKVKVPEDLDDDDDYDSFSPLPQLGDTSSQQTDEHTNMDAINPFASASHKAKAGKGKKVDVHQVDENFGVFIQQTLQLVQDLEWRRDDGYDSSL